VAALEAVIARQLIGLGEIEQSLRVIGRQEL
jgi:hypothetical protein